jgi:hypothetical protein
MSETAAKFDMSTTLPLPTTHRERQNTREGTGEMGSVTSTAEFRAPNESNTSPHQQGGGESKVPTPPKSEILPLKSSQNSPPLVHY